MSLPGLGTTSYTVPIVQEPTATLHELQRNTEWRFEVAFDATVEVKLLTGTAEIFGTELALSQPYSFTGSKSSIYTYHGCTFTVTGKPSIDYVAEETPMTSYLNLHFALEALRSEASDTYSIGPRVLVVGPENAGKTSLVKLLASYATRAGRQPVVVNLDPKEGMLTMPGTISAVALESILDVQEGWGSSTTNGPSMVPTKLPLVYYYGYQEPDEQKELFKPLVTRLALAVMNRIEEDPEVKGAGCVIDTCGSVAVGKGGYDVIQHIVSEFSVNILIVLGSERLYSDMTRRFASSSSPLSPVTTVKLDKSGGCVDRDSSYLSQLRQSQIREYFFGSSLTNLSPHSQYVDFSELSVWRVPDKSDILPSFLPGGDTTTATTAPLEHATPSSLMQNTIFAIVDAEPNDTPEAVRDASVIGFVYVEEVDEKKGRFRILAPLNGRIPRQAVVWGGWPEVEGDMIRSGG